MAPAVRRGAPWFKKGSFKQAEHQGITVWYTPEVAEFKKPIVVGTTKLLGFQCLAIRPHRL